MIISAYLSLIPFVFFAAVIANNAALSSSSKPTKGGGPAELLFGVSFPLFVWGLKTIL